MNLSGKKRIRSENETGENNNKKKNDLPVHSSITANDMDTDEEDCSESSLSQNDKSLIIWQAAQSNNLRKLEKYLNRWSKRGSSERQELLNWRNPTEQIHHNKDHHFSSLLIAAHKGHVEIVRYLIKQGVDINSLSFHSCTALHQATIKGSFKIIEILINAGINVTLVDNRGATALNYTMTPKKYNIFLMLSKEGIDLNLRTISGMTLLDEAATFGNVRMIRELLALGADVNLTNDDRGRTLLHRCIPCVITTLLSTPGISPYILDNDGNTPMHVAARDGYEDRVLCFLENGIPIDYPNQTGRSALHLACYNREFEIVKLLVDSGANVNLRNHTGITPLYEAALANDFESVQYLVEEGGANINAGTFIDNCTPLICAVNEDNIEIVEYLIKQGAYLNVQFFGNNIEEYVFFLNEYHHILLVRFRKCIMHCCYSNSNM